MTEYIEVRKAFARALMKMPDLYTDAQANAGRMSYKYMQLPTMLAIVKPVLAEEGLALYQAVENEAVVTCFIHAETGETLCVGAYPMQISDKAQDQGSALTYARRYSLMTALGVMPDKDDDGALAQAIALDSSKPAEVQKISHTEYDELIKGLDLVLGVSGNAVMPWLSKTLGRPINRGGQLTKADAKTVRALLEENTAQ